MGVNRTDRLVAMVMYLQGRRVVKAEDLAAHFEVNIRTVYRDIAALGEAGVPISGEAGVGYSLVRGYHLPPVSLTPEEAVSLFLGGEMVRHFGDASMQGPMGTALLKLQAVLPREYQDEVGRLGEATCLEARGCGPDEIDQKTLLPVYRAIVGRRVMRLHYCGLADARAKERCVEPLGVTYHTDAWYLIAWCRMRSDIRQFRLSRIRAFEILAERFLPRSDFSVKTYLQSQFEAAERLTAHVWFHPRAVDRARRQSMNGFTQERTVLDGVEVEMKTYSLAWFARWIASFGPDARVLGPEALRQEMAELGRQLTQMYGSTAELLT